MVQPLLILDMVFRVTFGDVLEEASVFSVASETLLIHSFSFRIKASVFVSWPELSSCLTGVPMGVSLVLRSSSLHFTHYSHFLFIPIFIFFTLVNSTEEGHICRPPSPEELELARMIIFAVFLRASEVG